MKPSETAQILRRIAAAIDNSKTPDRAMVAADLKKVLHRVAGTSEVFLRFPKGDAGSWMEKEGPSLMSGSSIDWNVESPTTVVLHVPDTVAAPGQAENSPVFHIIDMVENGTFRGSGVEVYEHRSSLAANHY